ncbi:unnamed protein product [Closterium sp. Yama58-4]|nr:unnamed protein product [Closterium sp. Yama58-4]
MANLPRFDLTFAFREASFSDCVLRLVIESPSQGMRDASPATDTSRFGKGNADNTSSAAPATTTSHKPIPAAAAATPQTPHVAAATAHEASTSPAEPLTRDVPAASVVLASKSTFFRALFTSGFSETLDRRLVHIHLFAQGMF